MFGLKSNEQKLEEAIAFVDKIHKPLSQILNHITSATDRETFDYQATILFAYLGQDIDLSNKISFWPFVGVATVKKTNNINNMLQTTLQRKIDYTYECFNQFMKIAATAKKSKQNVIKAFLASECMKDLTKIIERYDLNSIFAQAILDLSKMGAGYSQEVSELLADNYSEQKGDTLQFDTLTLTAVDGQKIDFNVVDLFVYQGKMYVCLLEDGSSDVLFCEVIKASSSSNDNYIPVEDMALCQKLYDLLRKRKPHLF